MNMSNTIEQKKQKLADILQLARVQKGLSQDKLAEMIGVNHRTIGKIELCKYSPNLDILYKLTDALEIELKLNDTII